MAGALALAFALGNAGPSGAATGGRVLPPQARLFGYTLTDMARETAAFTTSGNDLANYPDTPFQILYVDERHAELIDGGVFVTGSNSFTSEVGTFYYVPIFNVNDLPPIVGEFPTTNEEARAQIFDADQLSGQFEIEVDGTVTQVGPAFVAGPVEADLGGEEGRIITLGVFLAPLPLGTHTVIIRGVVDGPLIEETFGLEFFAFEFVYTVNVVLPDFDFDFDFPFPIPFS